MTQQNSRLLNYVTEICRTRMSEHEIPGNIPEFAVDNSLPREGYRIENERITAGSEEAFLFGLGKFLRTGGAWRGESSPAKSYRMVYFPTHFNNFFHKAPLSVLKTYIEDMALLGYNHICMTVAISQYQKNDPKILPAVERIRQLYRYVKETGMNTVLLVICNDGYNNTPAALRAENTKRAFFGCEICPSQPGGMDLILENHQDQASWFHQLDAVILWSYDEGGCGCEKCFPWGANGMFETGKKAAEIYRKKFPDCKIYYSTWCFNYQGEKEFEGLYARLHAGEGEWMDGILADAHGDFPEFPLKHPLPSGKILINFPEISMWGRYPWGGFGATPLPLRFSRLWEQTKEHLSGGMLYSEGNYEDINKAFYAGFYWNGTSDFEESMREYCAYEFGCYEFDKIKKAILIMERNHEGVVWSLRERHWQMEAPVCWEKSKSKPKIFTDTGKEYREADVAWKLVSELEQTLPAWGRKSWRWRILRNRARFDYLLAIHNNEPDAECEEILEELVKLYHLDPHNACPATFPMTNQWLNLPEKGLHPWLNSDSVDVDF